MASLLVFAKANLHPDAREQWQRFAPGDVIDVADDDAFDWGSDIWVLGWWRVLTVQAPRAAVAHLLDGSNDPAPAYRGFRQLRMKRIDLAALPSDAPTLEQLNAAVVDVPPPSDYFVIG